MLYTSQKDSDKKKDHRKNVSLLPTFVSQSQVLIDGTLSISNI